MYKVLFITANLSSGGAERRLVTLAKLLKRHDLQVEVFCYSVEDFYSSSLNEDDIPVHWNILNNWFLRLIGVRRFIRRGNFDCVISFLEVPNFLNNFSAIGGRTWKVITGESSCKKSTFQSKRGKIFGWFQRYSDHIVCNSNNSKEMWQKFYPKHSNKLVTIYNPVILPPIRSEYISKLNGKIHIVIAASYQYLKNPIAVIKAVSLLDEMIRDRIKIEWYGRKEIFKGNTKVYDEANRLIIDNRLMDVVVLNEEVTNIAEKMNNADFVGLFSELEGLPNSICEGMMIGKPIIMTRVSDYERLVDETNGFLCEWDNLESIKEIFLKLIILNKETILEMGKNSKKKAQLLFDNKTILKTWLRLIQPRLL